MIKNAPDVMTVKEVMKVLRCGRTKIMEFIHNIGSTLCMWKMACV